jgi:protein-S-isoprenylcysteine O-methyltransferase Ste14
MSKITGLLIKIPVPWIYVLGYLISIPFQLILQIKFLDQSVIKVCLEIGIILFIIAAIIAGWSLLIFHKARTTTTPGIKSVKLIMTGPYRFSRNPMYISLFIAFLGEAAILNQICPLFIFPFIFYYVNYIIIPIEEDLLTKEFNGEYLEYQNKVPRWVSFWKK